MLRKRAATQVLLQPIRSGLLTSHAVHPPPPLPSTPALGLASMLPDAENTGMCPHATPSLLLTNAHQLLPPRQTQSFQHDINTLDNMLIVPNAPLYLLDLSSSLTTLALLRSLFHPYPYSVPMKTRTKNKTKHPAAPVMTPGQLAAAGLPQPQKQPRRQTKDQRIAALEEDLRATRELLEMVFT